jgi:N-methylhydantoinase A/oxoprolinase/acetone carboxylase beta subunit
MGRRRPEARQLFVDTGGTFTDVVAILSDGSVVAVKVPADIEDHVRSVAAGTTKLASRLGIPEARLGRTIRRVGLSASVAFDALRMRRGRRVGLVVTRGQEEGLEGDTGARTTAVKSSGPTPTPIAKLLGRTRLVSRELVLGVTERIDPQGRVLEPLREDEARLAARRLRDRKVEAVIVLTLFDFSNPTHEERIASIVREELGPSVPVTMGIDVSPLLRDWSRTTAAVVEASARPLLEDFVARVTKELRARGCKKEPVVMRAGGGVAALPFVRAIDTVRTGPIAACRAAARVASARGLSEVLLADIGGQSFDIAWVGRGPDAPPEIEGSSLVLSLSHAEVHRIGPGANARAWVEPPVGLRVGQPPGEPLTPPACFGWGGVRPTITDADLVLGYVSGRQSGGAVVLDAQRAREAIEEFVARPLKVGLVEAADAIRRQADAQAREGIRRRLSALGISPPSVTMVVGGGAGPVHAAGIAEGLQLRAVLIPPGASVLGALGTAVAPLDLAMERALTLRLGADAKDRDLARAATTLARTLRELESKVLDAVRRHGLPAARARISRLVALRSERMVDDVLLPIGAFRTGTAAPIRRLLAAFDREAEKNRSLVPREPDGRIDIYAACVCASVPADVPPPRRVPSAGSKPTKSAVIARRAACFGGQMVPTDVYDLGQVRPGNRIAGPALLEGNATTVVLPASFELAMEADRVLRMVQRSNGGGA